MQKSEPIQPKTSNILPKFCQPTLSDVSGAATHKSSERSSMPSSFKAEVFGPEGVPAGDKAAYDKKYGANLWREDIEQYDKVCKVLGSS